MVPYGKAGFTGSKFIAPGAAQGALRAASDESPSLPKIGGSALIGAGTGAVLQGAGKLIKKAGSMFSKQGDKLAAKNLNLTNKQKYDFSKDTGESIDDFLTKHDLKGSDVNKLQERLTPLQDDFDKIATDPTLTVSGKQIVSNLTSHATKLSKSTIPTDKAKAKVIQEIAKNFKAQYGTKEIPAEAVTTLRRQVDEVVKDFGVDATVRSPLNTYRTVLQDSIRDKADEVGMTINGMSFKEAGSELSKFYNLLEKAAPREGVGKGMSITSKDLLAGLLGNAVFPGWGIAAGIGADKAITSPLVNKVGANVLSKAGGAMSGAILPPIIQSGVAKTAVGAASTLPSIMSPSNNNKDKQDTYDSFHSNSLPQIPGNVNTMGQQSGQLPPIGENPYPIDNYVKDITRDPKNAARYKDIYEAYQKHYPGSGGKPLSGPNAVLLNKAQTAVKAIDNMERSLFDASGGLNSNKLYAKKFNPFNQEGRQLGSDITSAIDLLGYFRTGAAITADQRKDYIYMFPNELDDKATVEKKIRALREEFQGYAAGISNAGDAVDLNELMQSGQLPPY